jgi:hypothetical protein
VDATGARVVGTNGGRRCCTSRVPAKQSQRTAGLEIADVGGGVGGKGGVD